MFFVVHFTRTLCITIPYYPLPLGCAVYYSMSMSAIRSVHFFIFQFKSNVYLDLVGLWVCLAREESKSLFYMKQIQREMKGDFCIYNNKTEYTEWRSKWRCSNKITLTHKIHIHSCPFFTALCYKILYFVNFS